MSEEYAIQFKLNNLDVWKILDARYYSLNEAKKAAQIIQRNFSHTKVIIIGRPQVLWRVVDEGGVK